MALTRNDKIKLFLLLVVWILVCSPVLPEMVREWAEHSDNNHGFLVPLIAIYFIYQKKDGMNITVTSGSRWGAAILLSSLTVYLVSYAGGTAFPTRVAMVTSLFGLLWYCLGDDWMRLLRFPVLFLLFMIPVPYSLLSLVSMPLQLLATKMSAKLIGYCSIPVYREGNMLFFVGTQLEVAEACSGIRSIMSLTMLGTIFAYFSNANLGKKALLVVAAVPIAMVANIVRITGTGVLANFFGDQVARGFLHEFSGMAVFAFGLVTLGLLYSLLNRKKLHDTE